MKKVYTIANHIKNFISKYLQLPEFQFKDFIEIIIITFLLYQLFLWIKNTKAWMVFKGIIVLLAFTLIAAFFNLSAILWIVNKTLSVGIIAIIIVFQPELRRALEQLGRKNIIGSIFSMDNMKEINEKFSDHTINEVVKATFELAKTKTGALMVIEQNVLLTEYELTGISLDSKVSRQLIINIFEHNTPLHDGAVIIRGNRIVSATCYLPLSANMQLSKELGTRHRAALGISEESDSLTIVVSEETGKVSMAYSGKLMRNIDGDSLKEKLIEIQNKKIESKRLKLWKGRGQDEKKDIK